MGKTKEFREKIVPVSVCPTTNATWTDMSMNPGLHYGRPGVSHGMAFVNLVMNNGNLLSAEYLSTCLASYFTTDIQLT